MKRGLLGVFLCAAVVASLASGCGSKSDEVGKAPEKTKKENKADAGNADAGDDAAEAPSVGQKTVYVTPE